MTGFFTQQADFVEQLEAYSFQRALARVEACRFVGEDGKERIDMRKLMPKRFEQAGQ